MNKSTRTNDRNVKKIDEALHENFMNAEDILLAKKQTLTGRLSMIADGFAGKKTLEEVNTLLKEAGYEALYARNFMESTLIYAFINELDYGEWAELYRRSADQFEKGINAGMRNVLTGTVTRSGLRRYLEEESAEESFETGMVTGLMTKRLERCRTEADLYQYLSENLKNFSDTREKARYYFCKYLHTFIEERCGTYLKACRNERKREEMLALEDIYFLKPLTRLKKDAEKKTSHLSYEEKAGILEETSIMPGGIFDEFNYYYGYINVDWTELIFERFGAVEEWDETLKLDIAKAFGFCGDNPGKQEWKETLRKLKELEEQEEKKEEMLDAEYARENMEGRKKLYQRYRSGENYFRDFLNGSRDINRETLIAFILFVSKKTKLTGAWKVDAARLNSILDNCGFEQLVPKYREFDRFIISFMKSSEPFMVMEERVDEQIQKGRNFDLYKVYSKAYSHKKENVKLVTKQA